MGGLTFTQLFKALVVEVIHNLWHAKLYRGNNWLKDIQQAFHADWVIWRAMVSMRDVDKLIEEMLEEPTVKPPIYWEEEEGETPLGGSFGYNYELDDAPGSADPLQGPE